MQSKLAYAIRLKLGVVAQEMYIGTNFNSIGSRNTSRDQPDLGQINEKTQSCWEKNIFTNLTVIIPNNCHQCVINVSSMCHHF